MFIVSHHPRVALKELPEGWYLEKLESGVYIFRRSDISMSIIVIPELNEEAYKLLTSLRSELSTSRLTSLINESKQYVDDNSWLKLINVLLEIHFDKIEKGEVKMGQKFLEALKKSPYGADMLNRNANAAIIATKTRDIIRFLTRRLGTPSVKLQKQINKVNDIEKLDELIDFAATCVSLDEFATAFN